MQAGVCCSSRRAGVVVSSRLILCFPALFVFPLVPVLSCYLILPSLLFFVCWRMLSRLLFLPLPSLPPAPLSPNRHTAFWFGKLSLLFPGLVCLLNQITISQEFVHHTFLAEPIKRVEGEKEVAGGGWEGGGRRRGGSEVRVWNQNIRYSDVWQCSTAGTWVEASMCNTAPTGQLII